MGFRRSAWKFDGCSSVGISIGVLAATKGELVFTAPSGQKNIFSYIGAGLGVGLGLKGIKSVGGLKGGNKMPDIGGSVSPSYYESGGVLYMTSAFQGYELTTDDLTGRCTFGDVGANLGAGGSGCIMNIGLDEISGNYKAILFFASQNTGIGVGANGYAGNLELVKSSLFDPNGLWEVRANGEIFYYRFKLPNIVQWASDRNTLNIKGEGNWQMKDYNMRIDWKSGDYEEWDLPLFASGQTGIWFTKGARKVETMAFQGVQGVSHKLTARKLGNTHQSNTLCNDEAMAICD